MRKNWRRYHLSFAWMCWILACRSAFAAAPVCIDPGHTPTGLATALANWGSTAGAAVVKIAGGTYPISILAIPFGNPGGALTLYGGYKPNTGCDDGQRNIVSYPTILDGGGTGYFLIDPDGPLVIDGMTFSNFSGSPPNPDYGNGVGFDTTSSAVTLTRFIADHDSTFAVGNGGDAPPNIVVQNCLIHNQPVNAAGPALKVSIDNGSATIGNCTIADNTGDGVHPYLHGLEMDSFDSAQINVYNTIAFNNGGYDFFVGNPGNTPNVYFSLYSNSTGINAYSSIVPVSNYTLFAGPGNYHLAQQSLAINAGDPNLTYPVAETDLDGNARVGGGRVDIGAYESNFAPNQFLVTSTLDDGSVGTLRWAVGQANGNPSGFSTIAFDLGSASGCPYTISLGSALPDITAPVSVDGRAQAGWVVNSAIGAFNGTLCVRIVNGASVGYAFHTASGASASKVGALGIEFGGFSQAAIKLEGGSDHNIGGNRFGGPSLVANHYAVQVQGNSDAVQIGGADQAFANVIDNSTAAGIYLGNGAGGSIVQNNVIGIAPDGTTAAGGPTGIFVSGSPNNTLRSNYIGYSTSTTSAAIVLYGAGSSGNIVQQNQVGWDFFGSLPNAGAGVIVSNGAGNNIIGSQFISTSFGNSIRNSGGPGVWITSSGGVGNWVVGNDLVGNGGPTFDNGLAIDLGGVGPDPNTAQGAQNYPLLRNSFALPDHQLIQGALDAAPNTIYRIDFYHLNGAPQGYPGRADAGLAAGFSAFVTDANGHCSFLLTSTHVQVGGWLSAAATPVSGNTSEISNAVADQTDAIYLNGFGPANGCQ